MKVAKNMTVAAGIPACGGAGFPSPAVSNRVFAGTIAFTLVEVMIATAIFFMAMFAILGVVSQGLRAAGSLKNDGPTAGMVLAELATTNALEEGFESGAFGDFYPDYKWSRQITFYGSNGLFQVDVAITKRGNLDSSLTTYLYRPESKPKR